MLMTKLKALAAVLLAVVLLGSGGVLLTCRTLGEEPRPGKNADGLPPAGKEDAKPKPEEVVKKEKEKLQGTWKFVTIEERGQTKEEDSDNPRRLIFSGDEFRITKGNLVAFVGKFTIDPFQSPKAIDLEFIESVKPQDQGKTGLAIYVLEGDTLKLCLDAPGSTERPKEFSARADEKHELVTLKLEANKGDAKADDKKAKADKEILQGAWVGVSGERDGRKLPEEACWKLVFEGDKVTLRTRERGEGREGTYTLDPDKKPKEIDLTLGSLVLTGIYELKGTTLKTLWRENDRPGLPTDFDSQKGILMIFEKK